MLEAPGGLLDGLQFKCLGDGRKDVEVPGQIFAVRSGRHLQFDKVAHCGSDRRLLVFKILGIAGLSLFLEFSEALGQRFRKVGGDRRFLCYDLIFHDV